MNSRVLDRVAQKSWDTASEEEITELEESLMASVPDNLDEYE
jgi:hypothetical protein